MTTETSSEDCTKGMKLSEVFERVWANYQYVDKSDEPSDSKIIQAKVEEGIKYGEEAVMMVNQAEVFTTNENIEEVPTNEIRYLLLPAVLGQLIMKKTQSENRFESMLKAQVYLIDFIRLLRLYGMTAVDLPKPFNKHKENEDEEGSVNTTKTSSATSDLDSQYKRRKEKVERFRKQKRLEEDLTTLDRLMKQEYIDDDVKRKYYITLLDKWLEDTLDSLDSLNSELELLHEMLELRGSEGGSKSSQSDHKTEERSHKPTGTLQPFIITKNDLQKQVFGLGYPSLPTFTVDEFYQQRVDKGIFPDKSYGKQPSGTDAEPGEEEARERRQTEKEEKEDDDEALRQARNWDDWKDDHRTGWGNTYNKG